MYCETLTDEEVLYAIKCSGFFDDRVPQRDLRKQLDWIHRNAEHSIPLHLQAKLKARTMCDIYCCLTACLVLVGVMILYILSILLIKCFMFILLYKYGFMYVGFLMIFAKLIHSVDEESAVSQVPMC